MVVAGRTGARLWSALGHMAAVCDAYQCCQGCLTTQADFQAVLLLCAPFVVPPHLGLMRICCLLPAENEKIITKTHGTITHMVSMGRG